MKCTKELLILANHHFLALFYHFKLLFKGSGELLRAFHFLIAHAILEISNFLLKGQFVADEYVIYFLVLHGEILNGRVVTLRVIYRDLHFYSAFFNFRSY